MIITEIPKSWARLDRIQALEADLHNMAARAELAERVHFWQFCQWAFFRQWLALKAYANEQGVEIVGDAPIFIVVMPIGASTFSLTYDS
jgi:4-alpha-glucanotransferase